MRLRAGNLKQTWIQEYTSFIHKIKTARATDCPLLTCTLDGLVDTPLAFPVDAPFPPAGAAAVWAKEAKAPVAVRAGMAAAAVALAARIPCSARRPHLTLPPHPKQGGTRQIRIKNETHQKHKIVGKCVRLVAKDSGSRPENSECARRRNEGVARCLGDVVAFDTRRTRYAKYTTPSGGHMINSMLLLLLAGCMTTVW